MKKLLYGVPIILNTSSMMMRYVLGMSMLLSLAAQADELFTGAGITCLPETGQLQITPAFYDNLTLKAKKELAAHDIQIFPQVSGTIPLQCQIQPDKHIEGTVTYKDVGDLEMMRYRQIGKCNAPDSATLSLSLNKKVLATNLPLLNTCSWGHLQSATATPYGLTLCYQTPGGEIQATKQPKLDCNHYPYSQLEEKPLTGYTSPESLKAH